MNIRSKNRGFTIVELMIALVITSFIILTMFGAFKYVKVVVMKSTSQGMALKNAEKVITYLTKELAFAIGIEEAPNSIASFAGGVSYPVSPLINDDHSICIKMPALRSNLSIIDGAYGDATDHSIPLGDYTDHLYFWHDSATKEFKLFTMVNTNIDYGNSYESESPRVNNSTFIVARNINSITFTDSAGVVLSSGYANIEDLDMVNVAVETNVLGANGEMIVKELKTAIRFQNHHS